MFNSLAISIGIFIVAAQTAFLELADIVYPKANFEHAAASAANLSQGTFPIGDRNMKNSHYFLPLFYLYIKSQATFGKKFLVAIVGVQ